MVARPRPDGQPSIPKPPVILDRATGARIALARFATLNLSFAAGETGELRSAYDDLIGPNIAAVMARVGWLYEGALMRVDAFLPGESSVEGGPQASHIIASGWAGPIRAKDGSFGINVSYGVGASHRGAGLGQLLAYCAVAECLANQAFAGEPIPTFVNIQARATNGASLAVARSLGVPACHGAGFAVPARGERIEYVGFREPVLGFLVRSLPPTKARLPEYDPGALAAARLEFIPALDAEFDLLGWLQDSTAAAESVAIDEPERFHLHG